MQHCPTCKSDDIIRSRTRSRWERWRKEITEKRPFRCQGCGWRGWGVDSGPRPGEVERRVTPRFLAPEPPNLRNTSLWGESARPRSTSLVVLDGLLLNEDHDQKS
jgi:hypothetical protein